MILIVYHCGITQELIYLREDILLSGVKRLKIVLMSAVPDNNISAIGNHVTRRKEVL